MPSRSDRYWLPLLGILLVATSAVIYLAAIAVFDDTRAILLWLTMDLAFLPIQVLLVGIIIEGLLARRERSALQQKLNMVIGAFFSEVGNGLLTRLTPAVAGRDSVRERLALSGAWGPRDFAEAMRFTQSLDGRVDLSRIDLPELRAYLLARRGFLVRLLENPNLLEHDAFTDLLWAIFHLTEELELRPDLDDLPSSDRLHLDGDAKRVYGQLATRWIAYARHLKEAYPFLYSLVVRMSPFRSDASPTVDS